jgi:hypothetical protein
MEVSIESRRVVQSENLAESNAETLYESAGPSLTSVDSLKSLRTSARYVLRWCVFSFAVSLLSLSNMFIHHDVRAAVSLLMFILGEARKTLRSQESKLTYVPLVPPGRIVHLVKVSSTSSRMLTTGSPPFRRRQAIAGDTERYKPIWASNDDFGEIQITSSFFSDHDPTTICHELERIAESFGLSHIFPSACKEGEGMLSCRRWPTLEINEPCTVQLGNSLMRL